MKKIIVVLGSPRAESYSTYLANIAVDYLKEVDVEVEIFDLYKMEIEACIACDECRKNSGNFCVQDDDMKKMYKKISESAGLILACPIYWFTINAKMKLFIDRFYGFHTEKTELLKDKRIGVILSYGDVDPYKSGAINAIRTLEDSFEYTKSYLCKIVYGTELKTTERKPDNKINKDIIVMVKELCGN
ncbi:MAG: flavodoxin family protein [Bacteroidetes bacterium]|nr:flavodoxin family protein [Bacteroidota bacterium]